MPQTKTQVSDDDILWAMEDMASGGQAVTPPRVKSLPQFKDVPFPRIKTLVDQFQARRRAAATDAVNAVLAGAAPAPQPAPPQEAALEAVSGELAVLARDEAAAASAGASQPSAAANPSTAGKPTGGKLAKGAQAAKGKATAPKDTGKKGAAAKGKAPAAPAKKSAKPEAEAAPTPALAATASEAPKVTAPVSVEPQTPAPAPIPATSAPEVAPAPDAPATAAQAPAPSMERETERPVAAAVPASATGDGATGDVRVIRLEAEVDKLRALLTAAEAERDRMWQIVQALTGRGVGAGED